MRREESPAVWYAGIQVEGPGVPFCPEVYSGIINVTSWTICVPMGKFPLILQLQKLFYQNMKNSDGYKYIGRLKNSKIDFYLAHCNFKSLPTLRIKNVSFLCKKQLRVVGTVSCNL